MRFIFCLLLCFVATASATEPAAPADDNVYVVGFAQDTLANDWRLAQVKDVRSVLEKQSHIRLIVTDARGHTARQIMDIDDMIRLPVDVLITSPRDQIALTPVIRKAHEKAIPVVLLSRGILGDSYTTFIHPDNRSIAEQAARFLTQRLDGKGHILILAGVPGATTTTHRTEAFMQAIASHEDLSSELRHANYLRADALREVESLLRQGRHFDAIYAQSDSMATGARLALRKYGIDPASIPIVGIDYISEARDAIRSGEQAASYTYPTGGREGAEAALQILRGEMPEKEIILESVAVDHDNVDQIEPVF